METINENNILIVNDLNHPRAKWYIIHTYSGHENKVAVTLKQRAEIKGFTDKIFKMFIPTQQKVVISEGKKRNVNEKFPKSKLYVHVTSTLWK